MSDEICRCSHPKEFHQSFLKEVPCDYDGKCVGGCQKFEPVGSDRHPKWQRVEPGTVIPAGQPIRMEYADGPDYTAMEKSNKTTHAVHPGLNCTGLFVDSSWRGKDVLVSWEAIDKLRETYPPSPGSDMNAVDYFLREVVGDR